jgi:hypothetical protein
MRNYSFAAPTLQLTLQSTLITCLVWFVNYCHKLQTMCLPSASQVLAQVTDTPLFRAIQKLQELFSNSRRILPTRQDGRYHHMVCVFVCVCVCVCVYHWNIVIRWESSHNTQRNLLLQGTKRHNFSYLHPVITWQWARTCEMGEKIAAFTFRSVIMNCNSNIFEEVDTTK